jgi:hypothetical protein
MPTHTEDCQCAICKAGVRNDGPYGQHGPHCPCARAGCGNG